MNKEKTKKEYSLSTYIIVFAIIMFVIFDVVLQFGNLLVESNVSVIISRYLLCAVAGFLGAFIFAKLRIKRVRKVNAKGVKFAMYIVPLVIAIIMACIQINSANKRVQEYINNSFYLSLVKSVYGEEFDKTIKDAKIEAYTMWILTSVSFFIGSGIAAFCTTANIEKKMLNDEDESSNYNITSNNQSGGTPYYVPVTEDDSTSNESNENQAQTSSTNDYKWI